MLPGFPGCATREDRAGTINPALPWQVAPAIIVTDPWPQLASGPGLRRAGGHRDRDRGRAAAPPGAALSRSDSLRLRTSGSDDPASADRSPRANLNRGVALLLCPLLEVRHTGTVAHTDGPDLSVRSDVESLKFGPASESESVTKT
jgi:hypothetical protein